MSAWKKQAVPLVFLEIAAKSIIQENGNMPAIKRIAVRMDRWLAGAWRPLKGKHGRIDDRQAERITTQSAASIQTKLAKFWSGEGVQTVSELPNAMLVIAEDVRRRLPQTDKDRVKAWRHLVETLYDLCLVADPDLTDSVGQDRGIEIAGMVMREAA